MSAEERHLVRIVRGRHCASLRCRRALRPDCHQHNSLSGLMAPELYGAMGAEPTQLTPTASQNEDENNGQPPHQRSGVEEWHRIACAWSGEWDFVLLRQQPAPGMVGALTCRISPLLQQDRPVYPLDVAWAQRGSRPLRQRPGSLRSQRFRLAQVCGCSNAHEAYCRADDPGVDAGPGVQQSGSVVAEDPSGATIGSQSIAEGGRQLRDPRHGTALEGHRHGLVDDKLIRCPTRRGSAIPSGTTPAAPPLGVAVPPHRPAAAQQAQGCAATDGPGSQPMRPRAGACPRGRPPEVTSRG